MNNLAKRIKNVGPGALVAAAFIGPGTVTSCSISGATAGYTLLWAMLLSVISVIIMQSMAARLGIVSGMGLGEALREKFTSTGARVLIAILVIAAVFIGNIAYETGNLTGSIMGIQAAVPAADNGTAKIVLALILGVIAFALLYSGSYQRVENFLTALVVLMGVIFLICAFAAKPDWGAVFAGLFGFTRLPRPQSGGRQTIRKTRWQIHVLTPLSPSDWAESSLWPSSYARQRRSTRQAARSLPALTWRKP